MEVRHGAIVIDVPNEWEDRSTLLFVAPQPQSNLPTANEVHDSTEAVSVRFVMGSDSAEDYLAAQAAELAELRTGHELQAQGTFACGLDGAWHHVRRVEVAGQRLRQLAVAAPLGPMLVVATAAAGDARFDFVREQLTAILSSLRLARGAAR